MSRETVYALLWSGVILSYRVCRKECSMWIHMQAYCENRSCYCNCVFFVIFNITVPSIKSFCSIKGHFKQRFQGKVSWVLLKNAKLKRFKNFCKIAKFKCREICAPQNRESNMSRKFHAIRYITNIYKFCLHWKLCCVASLDSASFRPLVSVNFLM